MSFRHSHGALTLAEYKALEAEGKITATASAVEFAPSTSDPGATGIARGLASKRGADMTKGSRVVRTCVCGSEFSVWPSDLAKGGGKFCSRACAYANRPVTEKADRRRRPTLPPQYAPDALGRRALAKTRVTESGCWEWIGWRDKDGYGVLYVTRRDETGRRRSMKAHRWLYQAVSGVIDESLDLDHLCRNRACLNPAHLEPVDHRTNVMRGLSPTSVNARKTHCKHGHEFTPENTRIKRTGGKIVGRQCRTCDEVHNRGRRR